jgi:hypothetical protein
MRALILATVAGAVVAGTMFVVTAQNACATAHPAGGTRDAAARRKGRGARGSA